MLTHADKQIIASDMALPGLAALLDSDLLLSKLQQLPRLQSAVKIQVKYLRYIPANSCACSLKVQLADGSMQYYFAKALTPERFAESWNNPKRQKLIQEKNPNAPLALFDLYIMLLHPAHDRSIRYLGWLVDPQARGQILQLCGLEKNQSDAVDINILRYKPERRLVAGVRYNNRYVAVVRCIHPKDFGKILSASAFGIAQNELQLLGVDGTNCTLATRWLEGRSLCPEEQAIASDDILAQLANKLYQLHHNSYQPPIKYGIANEIQSMQGVLLTFNAILPQQATWFAELMEQTVQGLQRQKDVFQLIHGDFSLDQVVENQGKLHLLDWDRCAAGNPLMDLATFIARLEFQVIEGFLPSWQANRLVQTFLYHYQKNAHGDLSGLTYFVASALLRLATEPFRKRTSQWAEYTLQLLQRVSCLLNEKDPSYLSLEKKNFFFENDPLLGDLTHLDHIQTRLMKVLPPAYQGQLISAKVQRYKPQRRAMVDYVIDTEELEQQCIIGKYRCKGLDSRAFNIQQALWQEGFNDQAHISVAEPLGMLPEQHTWLQRKVNGQSLGNLLAQNNKRLAFLGESVALALNQLHKSKVAQQLGLPIWTIDDELAILHDRLTQAQTLLPALAERIGRVLSGCEKLTKNLDAAQNSVNFLTALETVSVHRDFYQDQILERNGRPGNMVLLDLDLLCQGHAALDAGNYLAHIIEFAIRHYGDIHALQQHQDAFLSTFLTYSATANKQSVDIYTTLSLARHIYLSTQFADRKHTTETLLTLCEDRLGD